MAKEKSDSSLGSIGEEIPVSATEEIQFMPLRNFADSHALNYGIELMAGFYHEQEADKHFSDPEDNWHTLLKNFSEREVK